MAGEGVWLVGELGTQKPRPQRQRKSPIKGSHLLVKVSRFSFMHFKLKVQKLGTLHFCLCFKFKSVKAKLKRFSLLYLKNKQIKKYTKVFIKTENGALHLFHW